VGKKKNTVEAIVSPSFYDKRLRKEIEKAKEEERSCSRIGKRNKKRKMGLLLRSLFKRSKRASVGINNYFLRVVKHSESR
jgi:hypothetical protein